MGKSGGRDERNEYARPGKDPRRRREVRKGLAARRRAPQSRGGFTRGDECGVPRGPPAGGVSSRMRGFLQERGPVSCSGLGGKEDVREAVVRRWARWGKWWIRGPLWQLREGLHGRERSKGAVRSVRADDHCEVRLFARKICRVVGCFACCVGNGGKWWGTCACTGGTVNKELGGRDWT